MTLNTLLSFTPLIALIYVAFAFVQAIRRQRQSFKTVVLALILVVFPLAAYFLSSDFTVRLSLITMMAISTAIIFLTSLVVLLIERRNPTRDPGRSYGMIGISMSLLFAVGIVVMPMTQTAPGGIAGLSPSNTGNSSLLNVAALTPGAASNQNTTSIDATGTTAVAQALTAQTGLSTTDLTTQLNSGSTITQLVAGHNGDLNVVKTALTSAFDQLKAGGGMQAQMLSNFGSDSADVAIKLVEGQLPAQVQQLLISQLISGSVTLPQGAPSQNDSGGFKPPNGTTTDQTAPNTGRTSQTLPQGTPSQNGNGGFQPPNNTASNSTEITPDATLAPTEAIIRPTLIIFPTASPTPVATELATAEATDTAASGSATCTLVVDYNLNLRDKPSQEGSTVLVSIPFGTTVSTTGRTSGNWYSVTYEGQTGWISGDYVTAQEACRQLPQFTG